MRARGLERGVKLANEARARGRGARGSRGEPIEMGLDVFHTQRELQRVLQRQWRQAERLLEAAAQADAKVAQSKQRGRDARGVATASMVGVAQSGAACSMRRYKPKPQPHRIETALALFRPEGGLNDRQWAQAQIRDAIAELHGPGMGQGTALAQ